jgi:hypothetical protein
LPLETLASTFRTASVPLLEVVCSAIQVSASPIAVKVVSWQSEPVRIPRPADPANSATFELAAAATASAASVATRVTYTARGLRATCRTGVRRAISAPHSPTCA